MNLSITIVSYNNKEHLPALIKSIKESQLPKEYEIILTDNNSADGSSAFIKNTFPDIKLIQNNSNLGFAKAQNQAMKLAKGKYILILNPDTILENNAIKNMINFMEIHPETGLVGGRILNPDRSLQLSGKKFPTPLAAIFLSLGIHKLFPSNKITSEYYLSKEKYNVIQDVDHVMGSFMLVRKEAIDKTGFFDEAFFLYCEDVDLCMRIKQAGYKINYLPTATIIHQKGGSSKKESFKATIEHHKSLWQFYKKWHFKNNSKFISFLYYVGLKCRKWIYLGINLLSREKKVRY